MQTSLDYIVHHAEKPAEIGYSLIAAFILVYTGVAVSATLPFRLILLTRTALHSLVSAPDLPSVDHDPRIVDGHDISA